MEHYGGPAAPPRPPKPGAVGARVHAARASPRTAARAAAVSLERPRPDAERTLNAYVETPVAAAGTRRSSPSALARHAHATPLARRGGGGKPVVTAQPLPAAKAAPPAAAADPCAGYGDSILCRACGRCRCAQCGEPRPLPSRWLCNRCLCSCESVIDYASCMCCVKALFYHCRSDPEASRADEERDWRRWACAAALAPLLPCLCCYCPLRAAAAAAGGAYARAARRGCRCPDAGAAADLLAREPR